MLGLGDIVIPGILVALMLRLDDHVSPSLRWLEHKTCNMFETPSNQINFATRLADRLSYKFTRVSKLRNEIVHFMKSRVLPQNRISFDEYFRDPREVTNISWQHLLRIFLVLPVPSSWCMYSNMLNQLFFILFQPVLEPRSSLHLSLAKWRNDYIMSRLHDHAFVHRRNSEKSSGYISKIDIFSKFTLRIT